MDRSEFCLYDFEPPTGIAVSWLDPFEPDFLASPHAGHEELREAGPVVWLARYNVLGVARFDQVKQVLMNPRAFSSARGVGMEDFERHGRFRLPSVILETDPPDHDAARLVLAKALSPARMRQLKQSVEATAERLVDHLLRQDRVDAIPMIAEALPLAVFPDLIGIPQEGRERLLPHADLLFNSFGPRNTLFKASLGGAAPEWVEALGRRQNLNPEGLGAEIHQIAAEAGFGEEQAGKLVRALLQAGLDTTINGISAALQCLSSSPDQWRILRSDAALAEAAFEEAVRIESPVQTFFRTVNEPVELGGLPLEPGLKVLMFLGAANRDPRQFERPDVYDITRRPTGHVGFGAGIHHCVGRRLANLEAQSLLGVLARRVERLEPAGEPVRRLNNTVRGLQSLPLRLVAA